MTTFKVYLCAFQGGIVRNVEVPDEELGARPTAARLEKIFHWGQNIHQNVEGRCSVSVGDIIEFNTGEPMTPEHRVRNPMHNETFNQAADPYYRVGVAGFDRLDVDEADRLRLDAVLNYLLAITRRWGDPSGHVNGNAVDGVRRAVEEFRNEAGIKSPRGQTQEEE